MEQYYKIAGLTVKMDTFGKTLELSKPYLSDTTTPDLVISVDWKSFQKEHPMVSQDDCEYILTGLHFYHQLIHNSGLMLHASAVVVDDKAYLFSAPSGTGKSTHTKLWLQNFGERAYLLNDDKPALRLEDGVWYAYGTPWSGKEGINSNRRVPLAGICFLSRGESNRISPFSGVDMIRQFLEQTVRPGAPETRSRILELLDILLKAVPVWKMECNTNAEAAVVAYNAMSQQRNEA